MFFATTPIASLVLTKSLVLMLTVEPVRWCWRMKADLDGMFEDEHARLD